MKKFTLNNFVYDKIINEFTRNGTTLITLEGKSSKAVNGVKKVGYTTLTKKQYDEFQKATVKKIVPKKVEPKKVEQPKKQIVVKKTQFKPMKDTDMLPKGTFIINFDLNVKFKRNKKDIDNKDTISERYVNKSPKSIKKIMEELTTEHLNDNYHYVSDAITKANNAKVASMQQGNLGNVHMKEAKLAYELLGNVSEINKNDGQCVLDYILYECSKVNSLKKVNRQSLIKFFGKNCVTRGITTNQIIKWAKYMGNVTVHALNPFMSEFAHYEAINQDHYVSLCFIVNNNHCYPIVDTSMKKSIAENQALEISKVVFKVLYDDYEYVGKKITPELIKGEATNKKIVLIETNNLIELIQRISNECESIVYNMKFNKTRVIMFEHPLSKQVYIATDDFEGRKKISDEMKQETNMHDFTFCNDSFTELAKKYFSIKYGSIKKSDYSPDYMNIIENHKIGPYNVKVKEPFDSNDIKAYDIKGAYRSALINNDVPYSIFYTHSRITPFTETDELGAGEYYVNTFVKFGQNGTIRLPRAFYPFVLVKYLLEQNYITRNDITMKITASHTLPADTFKGFTQDVCDKWEVESKSLINNFIGDMNIMTKKISKGCVTDSLDIAIGTFFCEKDKGQEPSIYHVNDLYFLRVDYKTKLSSGHIPIWRHIISMGYIMLDKLCKSVCLPHTTVCHYKTDCISVINAKEYSDIVKNESKQICGDIRSESIVKICGRPLSEVEDREEIVYKCPQWVDLLETKDNLNDIVLFTKNNNCLCVGEGGSGKSWVIKQIMNDTSICFVVSNKACDNLRSRGVENVYIFDSYFLDFIHNSGMIPNMSKYKSIIIDEFYTVSTTYMKILVLIKRMYPNMQFKCFGDSKQTPAIESENPECDLTLSPTVMNLCGNNRVTLLYKFTRYDKTLHDVVKYFDEHNKLPVSCENKTEKECWVNLCYTNEKRNEINRIMFNKFVHGKEIIRYNDVDLCVGMPIICLFNSPKVGLFNSRTFTIVEINNEGVKLSDNVFVPKKLFTFKPSKTGKAKFDYAFCMTVHKFQGSEIKEDFCIYEIQKMDKRLLNTALTRGQTLDKVHFNYTTKKFIVRKFNEKSIASKIHVPQHKTGRIYLITNDQGQGYIGSTEKQIEERFEEHKTEAVNRNMEDFMKSKVKIVLVQEIKFTNKKTLLILEDQKINEYAEKYELMNVKINIRDKPKGIKHKQVVVEQKSYIAGKFKIECLEKTHTYRIRWCIDGEKNTKSFKWNKDVTKEEAYTKIKQVQLDLIKLFS